MKNYKLYILMRNDLPSLNAGKAMAQAAHAANHLVYHYGKRQSVKLWLREGKGFGTTITLAANKREILSVMNRSRDFTGVIYDTTYPYIVTSEIAGLISQEFETAPPLLKDNGQVVLFRRELTCGYVFMEDDNNISRKQLIENLPLYP